MINKWVFTTNTIYQFVIVWIVRQLLQSMSFCQNHTNHHCIHAHNCGSHKHKICDKSINVHGAKNNRSQAIPSILCRNSKTKLHKIAEINEQDSQCHFNSGNKTVLNRKVCQNCKRLQKLIDDKSKQLNELKKLNMEKQKKQNKLYEENRQLQAVVEYYREEIDRIVKCTDQDVRNEIKRHLKESTELAAKNKFLLNKLHEIQELVAVLEKSNEENQRKTAILRKQKQDMAHAYSILLQKLKRSRAEQGEKAVTSQGDRKKSAKLEQRYQIIIEQTAKSYQSSLRQNKKLVADNKQLSQQLEVLKQRITNQQKLTKMEQQSASEREIVLKKKVESYQKQIKDLQQNIAKLEKQLKLKDEQITFSKKVIEKQLQLIKQNKELFEQVKQDINEQNKQNRGTDTIGSKDGPSQKDVINKDEYIDQLKKQIKSLRERITSLESQSHGKGHSSQTIEEYILTIGASQAFKRIIQQKNDYIKKLIREKGVLYQQMV